MEKKTIFAPTGEDQREKEERKKERTLVLDNQNIFTSYNQYVQTQRGYTILTFSLAIFLWIAIFRNLQTKDEVVFNGIGLSFLYVFILIYMHMYILENLYSINLPVFPFLQTRILSTTCPYEQRAQHVCIVKLRD